MEDGVEIVHLAQERSGNVPKARVSPAMVWLVAAAHDLELTNNISFERTCPGFGFVSPRPRGHLTLAIVP